MGEKEGVQIAVDMPVERHSCGLEGKCRLNDSEGLCGTPCRTPVHQLWNASVDVSEGYPRRMLRSERWCHQTIAAIEAHSLTEQYMKCECTLSRKRIIGHKRAYLSSSITVRESTYIPGVLPEIHQHTCHKNTIFTGFPLLSKMSSPSRKVS
jgi:hypothetical protein